jgi:hypothetical protein
VKKGDDDYQIVGTHLEPHRAPARRSRTSNVNFMVALLVVVVSVSVIAGLAMIVSRAH